MLKFNSLFTYIFFPNNSRLVPFLFILFFYTAKAQNNRILSFEKMKEQSSMLDGIKFRNIGPTIMSGRVTDLAVNPNNANEYYIAYASGGVFHTVNNGLSMEPIFDNEATLTVGAIAMNWETHCLWVGTGEVNSSRSSYAGVGIYKTTDTGKHWIYCGLEESHHIGKILLHPTNANIAWVAVLGHLYTPNTERGLYKTIDGGKSWSKTLYINDTTGCIDIAIQPNNSDILYASTWTRVRHAWNFTGAGDGSAIWKSEDAGTTWKKITTGDNGFPQGKGVGRINISVTNADATCIYAVMDNNFNQVAKKEKKKTLKAREIYNMTEDAFMQLSDKELDTYLHENGYPEKYTAQNVKKDITEKKYTVQDVANWKLGDADNNLYDTPVYGAEVYKSTDAGATWKKTHSNTLDGLFFTYGYYFGAITVSPVNNNKLVVAGYTCLLSEDGGTTFKEIAKENCHADYHKIWINEKNDNHIIVGNDGGINTTYTNGEVWYKANNPAVGQFYAIQVDNDKPYNVYGGLQDNGTWTASSKASMNNEWQQSGINPYKNIGEGDGMQVQVDTRDNATCYVGYQFGNYYRMQKNTGDATYISPINDIGEASFRFNWQTPILLSKHNQDIFFIGSQHVHRSMNKGADMKTMSSDLTTTKNKGNIPYGTITSLSESAIKFGLLYAGSDDGNIWRTDDVGDTWQHINNGLPNNLWCTRVIASMHNKERVYCTLNGYRIDDFNSYVYVSNNLGNTWEAIGKNLPKEPINVIKEDTKNKNILYVGTDNGLYISIDGGITFSAWKSNLPRVAIHDIAIQERENEIILGTHGRSIYIAKLDAVQKLNADKDKEIVIYPIENIKYNSKWGSKYASYAEPVQTKTNIEFYCKDAGNYVATIYNKNNSLLNTIDINATQGMNVLEYNLTVSSDNTYNLPNTFIKADDTNYYLPVGTYTIEIQNNKKLSATRIFEIIESKKEPANNAKEIE